MEAAIGSAVGSLANTALQGMSMYLNHNWNKHLLRYQQQIDAWNQDFAQKQFDESVRQYEQNYDMQKNAMTYMAQDLGNAGMSPLAMIGGAGATAPSGGVSGGQMATATGSGYKSTQAPQIDTSALAEMIDRQEQRKWQAKENERERSLRERELDIEEERNQNDYYIAIEQNRINEENALRVNEIEVAKLREQIRSNIENELQRTKELNETIENRIQQKALEEAKLNQEQQRIAQEKLRDNRNYKAQKEQLKLEKQKLKNAKTQEEKNRTARRIDNITNNITNIITSVISIFGKKQ